MKTATLVVPDISCEHCEHAITEALTPIAGIQSIQVDIPTQRVQLAYDEAAVSLDDVKKVLAEEDYPVTSVV
jgi:copper chaperone CopZ